MLKKIIFLIYLPTESYLPTEKNCFLINLFANWILFANWKMKLVSDEKCHSCHGNSQWLADRVIIIFKKRDKEALQVWDGGISFCNIILSLCWFALSLIHRSCSQWRQSIWSMKHFEYWHLNYFLILLIKLYSWVCLGSKLSSSVHQMPSGRM